MSSFAVEDKRRIARQPATTSSLFRAEATRVIRPVAGHTQAGCACGGGCPQCRGTRAARLPVSQPGDRGEREAGRIAGEALRRLALGSNGNTREGGMPAAEKESEVPSFPEGTPATVRAARSAGEPLSEGVRAHFEPTFGRDLANVRVHTDAVAHRAAAQLDARAFAWGSHIWLGRGESTHDSTLMAHELAHVAQRSTIGAGQGERRIQRARLPCTSRRVVDIYAVSLPGSSRSPSTDVATANGILCQCGIELSLVGGESWSTKLLDLQAPTGTLNEYSSMSSPTSEETTMLAHAPGGPAIHAYYVPAMSASRGENFRPTVNPAVPRAVVVSDSAASDTLAHELGHILFDVSGHDADANNLMAAGSIRKVGVDELRVDQCGRT